MSRTMKIEGSRGVPQSRTRGLSARRTGGPVAPRMRARFEAVSLAAAIVAMPFPSAAGAQVANASAAALGLGESYTAAARGLDAVAWNPALLGVSGPRLSWTALTVRGGSGLDPIGLGDFAEWANRTVPHAVKSDWLARIEARGGEAGAGTVEATWAGLQLGPFAAQFSSSARLAGDVAPGVARLIMFGNADEAGQAQPIDLSGSAFRAHAYSTAAASFARAIPVVPGVELAVGLTAKLTWGHVLATSQRSTGVAAADPLSIELDFPVIETAFGDTAGFSSGSGFGVDVGGALRAGPWTVSASVRNVVNSFAWDADKLRYRPLSLRFADDSTSTETAAVPLAEAPDSVRAYIESLGFDPVFALGAAFRPVDKLMVAADLRLGSNDDLSVAPSRHVGAGVEYRPAPWLPVRLGAALVSMGTDDAGHQLGAGLGFDLGFWSLAASGSVRDTDRLGREYGLLITVLGGGR